MARAARNRTRAKATRASARRLGLSRRSLRQLLRFIVRAPKVHVSTPAPQVSVSSPVPQVQVEAPSVNIQAPKPIVIPAPIVQVEVEAEERAEEASMNGLRKELKKCMKQNQTIELLLESDWGPDNRKYRIGSLVRVEEGMVELRTSASLDMSGSSILIPLNRIVAVIPNLQLSVEGLESNEAEEDMEQTLSLHWPSDAEESLDRRLASG
ncbi:hypothetical protein [Brevibacillus choshinensis]|uniref:Uncharacterized protein n=1 Tax=Brevibacillus choshinensis TaxID=54911 RepID=A0ABX7FIB5_BRECH|nr:hypothetical protein [Brevibacillus choshinensis]QRG65610.1 hypothetical protein JNE38_18595 [Brevibacillus choshinensis]